MAEEVCLPRTGTKNCSEQTQNSKLKAQDFFSCGLFVSMMGQIVPQNPRTEALHKGVYYSWRGP